MSTAVVLYDPTLPHISIKNHIEARRETTKSTDNASRKALEGRLQFLWGIFFAAFKKIQKAPRIHKLNSRVNRRSFNKFSSV